MKPISDYAARGGAAYLAFATAGICMLALALPVMTLQVYDRIIPNSGSGTLPVLIFGVCVAVVLEVCLRLARGHMLNRSAAVFEHRASCGAINRILDADLAAMRRSGGTGECLNRLSGLSRMKDFHSGQMLITVLEVAFIPVYFALMYYIAGSLVLVPMAILGAFMALAAGRGLKLRETLKARAEIDNRRYDFLLDSLEGMHTLKAFCLEGMFSRRYEAIEKKSAGVNYDTAFDAAANFNNAAVFSHLNSFTIVIMGAERVMNGDMTSGALIATILLAGRIMQPVQRALGLWVRYQDYAQARAGAETLFSLPVLQRGGDTEPERKGSLLLRNVAFHGDMDGQEYFRAVNLRVNTGEIVRIGGVHGPEKTHLMGLVAGLYLPADGEILIDGMDPLRYPPGALRRHVGFLKAKGEVLRGTIRDNLTSFGHVPEKQARITTRLLGVERDIALLPRGYDTILGDNESASISPGLQQRIAIARVLAWDPGIILFDNADRNLDRNGYKGLYRLMVHLKSSKAIVMATEDANFAALADRNLVLDHKGLRPLVAARIVDIKKNEVQL